MDVKTCRYGQSIRASVVDTLAWAEGKLTKKPWPASTLAGHKVLVITTPQDEIRSVEIDDKETKDYNLPELRALMKTIRNYHPLGEVPSVR